ncbi:hypothetical protein CBQ26_15865 [Deinococcus indicus]|uniref:Uncharacterized protein n=1 Tax=Deinococcus indicus TaxID=223556 RepID=A0A246BGH8_9DEIO|nr:hypothetical protein CBQ26_15865 [Deinococcus indicus]
MRPCPDRLPARPGQRRVRGGPRGRPGGPGGAGAVHGDRRVRRAVHAEGAGAGRPAPRRVGGPGAAGRPAGRHPVRQ